MFGHIDPGPISLFEDANQDSDVEMTLSGNESELYDNHEMDHDPISNVKVDRMVIAIDFGTTFSSVAYIAIPKGMSPESLDVRHVRCIGNYPGYEPPPNVLDFRYDVPTELWYDDGRMESWNQSLEDRSQEDDQDSEGDNEGSSSDDDDEPENPESRLQFDDGNGIDGLTDKTSGTEATRTVGRYWGYEVQQRLNVLNASRDEARPLTRIKLNLISGSDTDLVRTDLRMTLTALRRKRIIKKDTDIYKHFLTHLLEHTKEELLSSNELNQNTIIQFVLCVPAKWPVTACRTMQAALEDAVRDVGLSETSKEDVCNLFIISEPEAAAECILAEARSELYVRFPDSSRPFY